MPIYEVTHPTGKVIEIEGDTPPTQADLDAIFARLNPPAAFDPAMSALRDAAIGAAKGVGRTAVGLGRLVHKIPGVSRLAGEMPADAESQLGLDATNTAQRVGQVLEQLAEFLVPAGAGKRAALTVGSKLAKVAGGGRIVQGAAKMAPRVAVDAATSAGVTAAQGGDASTAGAVGAAVPVAGKVATAVGRKVASKAVPLVRAAIKPTVTEMKRVAGASAIGIDRQADRLARFIIDNRITSPDKAQTIIDDAERELQAVLDANNAATDAPQRAMRYLKALERSAAKQGLPASDVAIIKDAARELVDSSPMGETVTRTVKRPFLVPDESVPKPTGHGAKPAMRPGLVDASGQPVMVDAVETLRQLRDSMPAKEALETARSSSRWTTRKAWGEQKGAATEAAKAVERGARDAVKASNPESKAILGRQGQAIQAKKVLDRKSFREANRDAVSLPAHVIAAGEIAQGRVPLLAFAANWLRNNQMKAGMWADQLGKAIERQDVRTVGDILNRLGVASVGQVTKRAPVLAQ